MLHNIMRFYKGNIGTDYLVFRYMKIQLFLYNSTFILVFVLFLRVIVHVFLFLFDNQSIGELLVTVYPFLISCTLFLGTNKLFKTKVKKILLSKYGIKSDGRIWRCQAYKEFQRKKFIRYLDLYNIYTEDKIILLLDMLEKEKKRRTLPPLIAPGIIIAFMIPNWIEFIKYQYSTTNSANEIYQTFIFISVLIVISGMSIQFLKQGINDLIGSLSKKSVIDNLFELIKEIQIHFPEKTE